MGLFDFYKQKSRADIICDKYYKDFGRKPYISSDRDFEQWEEMISLFPNMLVKKEMMIAYNDGLLPGHVYMLYWIDKIHRSRIPEYFEYEFGINFEREIEYLKKLGYLDNNSKVTDKGYQAVSRHNEVIRKKKPDFGAEKTDSINSRSESYRVIPLRKIDSIEDIPFSEYDQLKKELEFLNNINEELCKKYRLPRMSIEFNDLCFGIGYEETHYIFSPFTKTKRASKYPLSVRYSYARGENINPAAFGNIDYLQNGDIGKAWEVFWIKEHEGYVISLGQTKGKLVLKQIEHMTPLNGEKTVIAKESKTK